VTHQTLFPKSNGRVLHRDTNSRTASYGGANAHIAQEIGREAEFIPMKRLGGKCQRGVRRGLWANGEATTSELLEWAYPRGIGDDPRQRHNRRRAVRHAAARIAVAIGRSSRGKGRPVIWRLKPE
jgi:hypothetical protein